MEIKEKGGIALPELPKDKEYEDYIAAILQSQGFYLERGIKSQGEDVLELDIVSSKFYGDHVDCVLSEIKSGQWGFSDVFKVRGWMDYLSIDKGTFVVQKDRDNFSKHEEIANQLSIKLVNNHDLDNEKLFATYSINKEDINDKVVSTIRYSYGIESAMIKMLIEREKSDNTKQGFSALRAYLSDVKDNFFFESDPAKRLSMFFQDFITHKNITARINEETASSVYPEDGDDISLPKDVYTKLFYQAEKPNVLYTSLYVELLARLNILKACVEDIIYVNNKELSLIDKLKQNLLPNNIREGVKTLADHKYVYQYPYFWQILIYVFGGFILMDKKQEEYELLSNLTSIPVDKIDNALSAFDILFPGNNWFFTNSQSKIMQLKFFPLPLSGVGANFRRMFYSKAEPGHYDQMSTIISNNFAIKDLQKWNNLAYEYLKKIAAKSK